MTSGSTNHGSMDEWYIKGDTIGKPQGYVATFTKRKSRSTEVLVTTHHH